jgi:hypothetical protein
MDRFCARGRGLRLWSWHSFKFTVLPFALSCDAPPLLLTLSEQQYVYYTDVLANPSRGTARGCSDHRDHSGGLGTAPAPAAPAERRCRARTVCLGGLVPLVSPPIRRCAPEGAPRKCLHITNSRFYPGVNELRASHERVSDLRFLPEYDYTTTILRGLWSESIINHASLSQGKG